jgi:hypothetical protein
MMGIDMQITPGKDLNIEQTMTTYLIKHMFKKGYARFQLANTASIKVHRYLDPGFIGVALNLRLALAHSSSPMDIM